MITMSRCLSSIALSALLTAGAAHAAPADCPAAGIVAAAYQDASAPDKLGRIRLSGSGDVIALQSGNRHNPFAVTCKAWPAKPELLLAAVPVMRDLSARRRPTATTATWTCWCSSAPPCSPCASAGCPA